MYCSKDMANTLSLNTDRQTPELSIPSAINDLTDDANNGEMTLLDENVSNVCQNLGDSSRNSSLCQNAEDILQIPNDCQNTQDTSKYFKVCYVCGKVVHNVSIHLKMSHGEYKCGKCCQLFKTALELSSHQELHENNKYACDKCDLSFKKAFQYAIHYKEHSLLKDYKCPICDFTTLSRPSINNHIRYHENRYRFFCEECGRGFMNSTVCKEHVEGHSGIKRYKCDICNKSFLYSRYLSAHRKFNHKAILEGVEEVHECHVCHRRFSFGKSLIRHLSKIHRIGKDLRVKCNICQKQIANPYNLKMHMRIHTGEKPYICEKCGRGFTKKVYLRRHCDANHPEEL